MFVVEHFKIVNNYFDTLNIHVSSIYRDDVTMKCGKVYQTVSFKNLYFYKINNSLCSSMNLENKSIRYFIFCYV